jgi:GPH family glycoside/pentoside/hexuronide:cation symporter
LAIAVGIFIILGGIMPALFTREYFGSLPKDNIAKGFWKHLKEFFRGFAVTFKCRPFVKLCAATFLIFNGFQLGSSFSIYVMIYYVFGGNDAKAGALLGWFGTVTSLFTLAIIPLATWISTKVGKKNALLLTISASLIGYALKWVGYNPNYPYLLLVAAPFVSFGIGSLFTLICAMVADVCDYDELQTGQRREGMFGAIYWWMVKIGMSLAGLLTGLMLNASGFDVALGGAQSAKTLFLLRVFDVGTAIVTSALAILVIATFDITEEKAHEIRLELEKRRGKPAS